MNNYQILKNKARQQAIDWQSDFENHNFSYSELADYQAYFATLAKRYGLVKEFKENGII